MTDLFSQLTRIAMGVAFLTRSKAFTRAMARSAIAIRQTPRPHLTCQQCGYEADSYTELRAHMEASHGDVDAR